MDVLIVASRRDPAGLAIHAGLAPRFARATDPRLGDAVSGRAALGSHRATLALVDAWLPDWSPPSGFDLVVFCSTHRAASENHALTVHSIGNFGSADLGGRPGTLVPTHPGILTALYRALRARSPETAIARYEVSLEATHHGPFAETPSIFYELGASEENWNDVEAGCIMAEVLAETLPAPIEPRGSFFGLGSNHYCAGFDRLTDRFDFAGSCPKHALADVTPDQLRWIADRYDRIVLDWNSMGPEKRRIVRLLEELGIAYDRRKKLSNGSSG